MRDSDRGRSAFSSARRRCQGLVYAALLHIVTYGTACRELNPDFQGSTSIAASTTDTDGGATATEADLVAYCRPLLGGVKTPKTVSFLASLPRNATGKVLKREIREPL